MSAAGALVAVLLVVAGALLLWAHSFVDSNVRSQLSEQHITMPSGNAITSLPDQADQNALQPYAGQPLLDGAQAEAFADHYIKAHLQEVAGGKTYNEVSAQFLQMKPTDPNYQQVAQQRQTLFMGETLRGLLLNAYAFWKMGQIALIAAIAAFVGAGLLIVLAVLGFVHARRVPDESEMFTGRGHGANEADARV